MIIVVAGKGNSGKGELSGCFLRMGFTEMAFADPFKWFLETIGVDKESLYGPSERRNDTPEVLCGRDVRYALQSGLEGWGREKMHRNIWANFLVQRINKARNQNIVVTDARRHNELCAVRSLGAFIVRVVRKNEGLQGDAAKHPSETELDKLEDSSFDLIVENNGPRESLFKAAEAIVKIVSMIEAVKAEASANDISCPAAWRPVSAMRIVLG